MHPEAPQLPVEIVPVTGRKTASAKIRGAIIEIRMPRHWPKGFQQEVTVKLGGKLQRRFTRDYNLVSQWSGETLSFTNREALESWVFALNQKTFNVPVARVRLGSSKYNHLAQMNLRTRQMTVSRFCLTDVPRPALEYLILHELAHLKVPNHSQAFWAEVARFVPDIRYQRTLIAAFHQVRIYEAELLQPAAPIRQTPAKPLATARPESKLKQLFLSLTGLPTG